MQDGDAIATRSLAILDAWAAQWTTLSAAACAPDPTFAHSDAQRRCLASALPRFDALVQQSLELETFSVDDALAAAALRLPVLAACGEAAWLAVMPAAPSEAQRGEVGLVEGELANAEALTHLDQLTAAPTAAERVVERARTLGFAPLLAETQLALGVALAEKYETDAAVDALQAAATTAQGGVHDRVFARAALLLIEQTGGPQQRPADALRWQHLLAPVQSRLADPWLTGALAGATAAALHGRAEYTPALASYETAVAQLTVALGEHHPELARMQLGAAATHLALGQPERATVLAAAADAILLAAVGPGDLRYAAAKAMAARAAIDRGDLEAAGAAADAAAHIPLFSQSLRHDFDHGTYLGLVGDVAAARGDTAGALASYDKAKIYLYVDAPKATPLLWEGRLRIDTGSVRDGLARLDEALAILDANLAADDARRIDPLLLIGRAQRRAKKLAAARTTLERALAIVEASYGFSARTALVQHELAALEVEAGHVERALELYDDAHLPLVGAFDLRHPRIVASLLARADLAFGLGQAEYAGRLYGSIADDLMQQRGPKDAATMRARARRGPGE
jgi:tetratricopeptide (TPR) repeat protein